MAAISNELLDSAVPREPQLTAPAPLGGAGAAMDMDFGRMLDERLQCLRDAVVMDYERVTALFSSQAASSSCGPTAQKELMSSCCQPMACDVFTARGARPTNPLNGDNKTELSTTSSTMATDRRGMDAEVLSPGDTQGQLAGAESQVQIFELHPIFQEDGAERSDVERMEEDEEDPDHYIDYEDELAKSNTEQCIPFCRHFMLSPASSRRLWWDCVGMLVLGYDLVMIPIQTCFHPPSDSFMDDMSWVTLIYWSVDIPASFCVGYYEKDGRLTLRFYLVAKHYLRTWLLLDVLIAGIDWLMIAVGSGSDASAHTAGLVRTGKMLRGLRILRVLRLLRLAKLRQLLNAVQDRIDSEYLSVAMSLFQLLFLIMFINHFVACAWYAVSYTADANKNARWIDMFTVHDNTYTRYFISLHWSITQFTPGSMPVQPQNLQERFFSILVLLLGLVVFSSFVSSITATMNRLRNLSAAQATQYWLLRKYFREHKISHELCARVNRYVSVVVWSQQKFTQQKDVALLQLLSGPLRTELQGELWKPKLISHPFFERLDHKSQDFVRDVCGSCVDQVLLSRGDVLFNSGKEADKMYFLWRGFMAYDSRDNLKGHIMDAESLHEGQWCCEAVLWMRWIHQGRMRAKIECDLMTLAADKFRDVAMRHPAHFRFPRRYAHAFLSTMRKVGKEQRINDVQLAIVEGDLVMDVLNGGTRSCSSIQAFDSTAKLSDNPVQKIVAGAALSASGAASSWQR
eukprot:gnl/TRDRNA2_/TRDRNA2_61986_c0_seq1.p1 gnl/TRDRNA2_/TRDRNA2_61986_c0~~gnl/TRDRNA2_/TRDRNA2_61986_c0_seq1.p1  ORF type:complete len:742 (+),score=129.03 gnl/TRDRNA2_/TRDRNA2_61986_c0_seq1:103-2328(+)